MERKFQVFVSSTYEDLRDERAEVIQALLELDCIPVGMELFPASDDDQWTLIKRLIADCDYYILIIGGRYGSTNSEGISFTELEYDYAISMKVPVISFLHKKPEIISVNKTDRNSDLEEKLTSFRDKVSHKMIKYWESPVDLGSVVSRSIIKIIKSHPQPGWVKGDNITSEEAKSKILQLQQEINELQKKIKTYSFDEEELSQGEDEFMVEYILGGNNERIEIVFSWNDLFNKTSPLLIDETSENDYKSHIEQFIKYLRKNNEQPDADIWLVTDHFKQIIIQFKALGLIKKGSKKRSLKDTDTYWVLTEKGDALLTNLRALRR